MDTSLNGECTLPQLHRGSCVQGKHGHSSFKDIVATFNMELSLHACLQPDAQVWASHGTGTLITVTV